MDNQKVHECILPLSLKVNDKLNISSIDVKKLMV